MVLSVSHISKSYGEQNIISDISFILNETDRLSIVGANGAGKTTLLKIIVGELESDEGDVIVSKNSSIGYLSQYVSEEDSGCIIDIVRSSNVQIIGLQNKIREIENRLGDAEHDEDILIKYHELLDSFNALDGNSYESRVTGALIGLGFGTDEFNKDISELSGGQKTRVYLAKLLVMSPDILILDEPTNHLDIASITWLENFLNAYKGAIIVVSHDRYFLDKLSTKVLDISNHKGRMYEGNYTDYTLKHNQFLEASLNEYKKQQDYIAHQKKVIDKLKQFNREKSIRRAESREKQLDKIKLIEKPKEYDDTMSLLLYPDIESGNDVLEITNLSKSFEDNHLFSGFDMLLTKGEHVAIVGENGTGKTTLLKIINGLIEADEGEIRFGANVVIGYYDQEQQNLHEDKTIYDEIADDFPALNTTKIRNVLAAFMFIGDDVYKVISDLSGGERGRVSLAKLMLKGANLLILDEPTNHLDMDSKAILEKAIINYPATVLYVSHDRYFINKTAEKIVELDGEQFSTYYGDYDYYVEKKSSLSSASNLHSVSYNQSGENGNNNTGLFEQNTVTKMTDSSSKTDWETQKKQAAERRKLENKYSALEKEIESLESEIEDINKSILDPVNATNSLELSNLSKSLEEKTYRLDEVMEEWMEISEMLD